MSRRHEETILKDIVELADRYDTPIRTALRLDMAPEDAILRQARLGRYDLVVVLRVLQHRGRNLTEIQRLAGRTPDPHQSTSSSPCSS